MVAAHPTATWEGARQLVVYAAWEDRGLRVRFADGCDCFVPADAARGRHAGAPSRIALSHRPPLGVSLAFGNDEEFLPWDWLRHHGDPEHRQRARTQMTATKQHVAARLRTARLELGLTQHALATRAGVSRATIARLEAGHGGVTLRTLQHLAAALGRPFDAVFGGD